MTLAKELNEFLNRGSVVELGVAVAVGAAFTLVVNSFTNDIIMPFIGYIIRGVDFSNLFFLLNEGVPPSPYATLAEAQAAGATTVNYGLFIVAVFNFLIVGTVLFFVVKAFNSMQRKREFEAENEEPSEEIMLLREIRDTLKSRQ